MNLSEIRKQTSRINTVFRNGDEPGVVDVVSRTRKSGKEGDIDLDSLLEHRHRT